MGRIQGKCAEWAEALICWSEVMNHANNVIINIQKVSRLAGTVTGVSKPSINWCQHNNCEIGEYDGVFQWKIPILLSKLQYDTLRDTLRHTSINLELGPMILGLYRPRAYIGLLWPITDFCPILASYRPTALEAYIGPRAGGGRLDLKESWLWSS